MKTKTFQLFAHAVNHVQAEHGINRRDARRIAAKLLASGSFKVQPPAESGRHPGFIMISAGTKLLASNE